MSMIQAIIVHGTPAVHVTFLNFDFWSDILEYLRWCTHYTLKGEEFVICLQSAAIVVPE